MKTFVRVNTSFFVDNNWVCFYIDISVNNLSLFLQSFTRFYNYMEWNLQNKDLPLQFMFEFTDYPLSFPNKLIVSGMKYNIRLITFSSYINKLLLKSK